MSASMFDELLKTYEQLEPAGSDTWNPLHNEIEMWHRVRLFMELRRALGAIPPPLSAVRVLDVGCGNGRSARTLLEFGIRPENVLGIDLRVGAVEYARALNPAIAYQAIPDIDSWSWNSAFDLCMQCTVFSSIRGDRPRGAVAQKMSASVRSGGYVYWWDLIDANDFAGGDCLRPETLFQGLTVMFRRTVSLQPSLDEAIRERRGERWGVQAVLQKSIGFAPTHCSILFRKA